MVLPDQPPLTEKEAKYFDALKGQCNCNVIRDLNPRALKLHNISNVEGWYFVMFDSIPCNNLLNRDSLQIIGEQVASKLYSDILDSSFSYNYRNITVKFACKLGVTSYKSESFEYPIDKLQK